MPSEKSRAAQPGPAAPPPARKDRAPRTPEGAAGTGAEARGPGSAPEPAPLADGEANGAVVSGRSAAEPVRTGAAGRPRGDAPVALEDIPLEEQTPEMRWPPSSWVRVTNIVRHSTGEPIEGIEVGDVGHVTAALSQTLVLMFPTRDNRREVLHIDGIEAVDAPADRGQR